MPSLAVIVSTYNQPDLLRRCLSALGRQSQPNFDLIIADDGSDERTRRVINEHESEFEQSVRHVWQTDLGFRKTRILNKSILATDADYLVFMDGDCVAHPDFIRMHADGATPGHYLNGSMIRLSSQLSDRIDHQAISNGKAFESKWLTQQGGSWNRRYLRFSLNIELRRWLDRHSRTRLYWLGANSSCFRDDALAINGFDNRFSYGFEDGDFGNRLENYGVTPLTVRWIANILHLFHEKPWKIPSEEQRNLAMVTPKEPGGSFWTENGVEQLKQEPNREASA